MYEPLRAAVIRPPARPRVNERSSLFARVLLVFALLKSANNYFARRNARRSSLAREKPANWISSVRDVERLPVDARQARFKGTFEDLIRVRVVR